MSLEQREAIKKIKQDIVDAYELFSSAEDAQLAYLYVAKKCMNLILEDMCYGSVQEN